jgi:hypothetical protein
MKERGHVLKILKETKRALSKGDSVKLRELSNQTVHCSSIDQDPGNVAVAVIVYALSKIIERKSYQKYPGWEEFYKTNLDLIDKTISALAKNDDAKARDYLTLMRKAIGKLSGKLKIYIQDVFRRASINKASRIYEHGISLERTASLLGVTMFELAEYAGKTGISDIPLAKTKRVKERINTAMEMFR